MLTKNRLGRVRTVVLTIVALTGLLGMTLQPALARTPDVARPAVAVADLDIGALISQLRALILQLQTQIDALEEANQAPPAAEVDEDDQDEAEDVDDGDVDDVDEQNEDADDEDVDNDADENDDREDADDADDEAEDDHDDEDGDD